MLVMIFVSTVDLVLGQADSVNNKTLQIYDILCSAIREQARHNLNHRNGSTEPRMASYSSKSGHLQYIAQEKPSKTLLTIPLTRLEAAQQSSTYLLEFTASRQR
eukprot:4067542-Amphidinium_carterae.1